MKRNGSAAADILLDGRLSLRAKLLIHWVRSLESKAGESTFCIATVEKMMEVSRNTASGCVNELERAGMIERILPHGHKSAHHWRLKNE